MEAIVVLIIISLIVAIGFLLFFLKNVKDGDYDDLTSPSVRMLNDDEKPYENTTEYPEIHVKD